MAEQESGNKDLVVTRNHLIPSLICTRVTQRLQKLIVLHLLTGRFMKISLHSSEKIFSLTSVQSEVSDETACKQVEIN